MSEGKQKVGESSSGEVDNGFWSCRDVTDVVPLHTPRGLYLKPIAKINVSVNLPRLKTPGKTISIWEVMEKIRGLVQPDEFTSLKVAKSTLEFIRLEGDLSDRCRLHRVLARLDSQRLNLAGFPNVLKVRVAEAKDDFPTRHSWDSYFRDAKHMNELKPGERPDTIHVTGLPVKWFSEDGGNTPSEAVVSKVFKKWGPLRRVDVPASDVYRPRMRLSNNIQKFSFGDGVFFEAYVQYVEYMDFVKAMDALRGMKLLKKEAKTCLTALIKVDFDKTKHMSDSTVSHRAFERKRLIAQDSLAAEKLRKKEELEAQKKEETKKKEAADMQEKEAKRQKREEKRKIRVFRKQEEDKVSVKIAREEQKLIKAQRQLESIRLLDELFDRIKIKVEKKEIVLGVKNETGGKASHKKADKANDQESHKSSEKDNEKKSDKKSKKLKKKKSKKEKKKKEKDTKSGSSTDQSDSETAKKKIKSVLTVNHVQPSSSAGAPPLDSGLSFPAMYPRFPQAWYYDPGLPMLYSSMGRGGGPRGGMLNRFHRGRGRGYGFRRGNIRGAMRTFNPHIYNEQYYKYFANLAGQDYSDYETDYDDRSSRSRTRDRSKSRSRTRGRSKSRSRTRARSKSRSRTRARSKSRSRGRSKTRSRTRDRSKSRTRGRSKSRSRTRGRSKSRSGARTRSRSRSRRRARRRRRSSSGSRSGSRSRRARGRSSTSSRSRGSSRSRRWRSSNKRSRTKSRSPDASRSRKGRRKRSRSRVMITRARSRSASGKRRSQSSSWSMPKSSNQRSCSW